MYKITIIVLLLMVQQLSVAQQFVHGFIKEQETPNNPIVGANVFWAGTLHGTASDANGHFKLDIPKQHSHATDKLVVSFVGYRSDTVHIKPSEQHYEILLSKDLKLGEVVISERKKGIYYSRLEADQVQTVTSTELQRAACCNLSESFETNASVDVAYSDAVTGAKQIQMLGLSGIYVQTISENIPSMRGLAAPYGLGYTPGPWMQSIQISKGTSSVVNGYEAVTGQINIEYKKPDADEVVHINLYGNNSLKSEANFNYAHKLSDKWSSMILLHGEHHSAEIDDNGDNFLDMPHIKQINLINRWKYVAKNEKYMSQFGVKVLNENRQAGQVGAFNQPNSNLYGINIHTGRYELFYKHGFIFDKPGTSLGMLFSATRHNQNSNYGNQQYDALQNSLYFNTIYQGNFGSDLHTYKTGASIIADGYNETLNAKSYAFSEVVPGVFFQYNYNLLGKLNVLAGIRADYSSEYGMFYTPRLHAKYNILEDLIWRASVGKGYRTARPLAENSFMLASARNVLVDDALKQEEAINAGTNLSWFTNVGGRELMLSADYYRTTFINQVIRDMDSDVHAVHFSNLEGESFSNALQFEATYELFDGFTSNLAWRINDVKQNIGGELRAVPLISKYKGLISFSYVSALKKWQFDFTTQLNGGGRMPDAASVNPLWENTYEGFPIFLGQVTKRFKRWEFYVGGENLANFTMQNPIVDARNPWGSNFDGSMIWGPVHGRKIYGGLRYTIKNYD